jgi:hypothetical protein
MQPPRNASKSERRSKQVNQTNVAPASPNGNGREIDVTIRAQELMQGRGLNHKLFVLCPTPEPEPEPELERNHQHRTGAQSTLPEAAVGGESVDSTTSTYTSNAIGATTASTACTLATEPVVSPEGAPVPVSTRALAPEDLATLQQRELAMASSISVAASTQLIQPRPATQGALGGVFSDDDNWESEAEEKEPPKSAAVKHSVEGVRGLKTADLDNVERVVQKAEAAVAQARKNERHARDQLNDALSGGTTISSLYGGQCHLENEDTASQCTEEEQLDDGSSDEDIDTEILDTGMPEAFRAGMQAKLSGTF